MMGGPVLTKRGLIGIYYRAHKDPKWVEGVISLKVCLENHLAFEDYLYNPAGVECRID